MRATSGRDRSVLRLTSPLELQRSRANRVRGEYGKTNPVPCSSAFFIFLLLPGVWNCRGLAVWPDVRPDTDAADRRLALAGGTDGGDHLRPAGANSSAGVHARSGFWMD